MKLGISTNLLQLNKIPHNILLIIVSEFENRLFEKGCGFFMKQLVNSGAGKKGDKERTAVLRLEMDYELATLFEAIKNENEDVKKKSKQNLERIRQELLKLKAL